MGGVARSERRSAVISLLTPPPLSLAAEPDQEAIGTEEGLKKNREGILFYYTLINSEDAL